MICHVVPAISEEASGPAYTVRRLCEALLTERREVELAALDWSPMASPPDFLRRFPLGIGPARLGRSPAMYRWLEAEARSGRMRILHNHSLWMMPNVYPGWLSRKYGVPQVVAPRGALSEWAMASGSPVKSLFWRTMQRPALAAASCFHATSASEYEDIRRLGFRQPVAIIPNGIDIPDEETGSAPANRILLFLGRLHRKKGLDMLLPAWAAVQAEFPDWHLRIVGSDERGYGTAMASEARARRLERVEFTGPLFGPDKHRAYRDAALFVLPTYSENFGMSVAEALAAGTPAIVSRGAPWEGLATHDAGWWIDIGTEPLIACLRAAMAETPAALAARGARGRAWMREDFSWTQVARQMGQTYDWLLGAAPRPESVVLS